MKALSSIRPIQHYVANNRDSQRSTDKVLQRIKYKADRTRILTKDHIFRALEKEHISHSNRQLSVLEEVIRKLKLQDEDDFLFSHRKNLQIIKKIENTIIDIIAKQNYQNELVSIDTEDTEDNIINCSEIFLRQHASNCFTVSALQLILQYYKNIDLENYLDDNKDGIVIKFPFSSYSPSKNIVQKLDAEGYKITLNSFGKLCKVLVTHEKLQYINSSKQNVSILYHRKKPISETQELNLKTILNTAIHLHGRIAIIAQKMIEIADQDDASMCAYDLETGNPLYATKLFGFDEQYEIPLVEFIKNYKYLSKFLNDDAVLLIVSMFYNWRDIKQNKDNTVGHCWSLLNYDNVSQFFEFYNPHGQREKYTYLEILHYCPTVSIFSNKKLNIECLNTKYDDYFEDISYDYKKHIYFSEEKSGEKIYYYKENNLYHKISGIYKCFDTTRIFDHGVIIGNNVTFVKKYVDQECKLYQVFQDRNGDVVEILFNGIYQDHFYKTGSIVKNLNTKHVLHPNTDARGKVLSSDKVQYCRYF